MKTLLLHLSACLLIISQTYAQDTTSLDKQKDRQNRYPKRAAQIGFIPPLSTNGLESGKVSNRFSLNALGSYAAALDGVELSGLFNVEKDYVDGVQFAGIVNSVGNELEGAQFAGITNIVGGNAHGSQFGGIANVVGKGMKGAQFAGIANLVGQDVRGVQIAGIANIANAVTGPQIAGIVNIAGRIKGAQIGLINIARDIDGPQIGLISLSPNGYRRFEVWASDALHANVAFKMGGNRQFYNIFALGATVPTTNRTRWGYGYGIGTNQPIGKRVQLSLEAISYQIHEENTTWDQLNMLNQARFSFIFPIHNRMAFTLTPTFNVQVSRLEVAEGIGSEWVGWSVYDHLTDNGTRVRMWPGATVGLQF
ncbi:DUF1326 domain-containing protein [Spirosoma aureum]|uniref:DUF1326 domain-containing protein n=1 Tax=Spirosoma aureum TaxID=2692134 RepID=A0A6G9AHF4_9BACT|nr:DUF1326 domain-containing protein [Spirosoma aureum]QIP11890.1 DUF1326 domain-containing protein [Spirosoma aureum]